MAQGGAALVACLFLAGGIVIGISASKYRGHHEVKQGHPFNVTCTVAINEGVSWTKDGRNLTAELGPFTIDERKINESVEATLTVQKAGSAHAGSYQCSSLHKTEKHSIKIASGMIDLKWYAAAIDKANVGKILILSRCRNCA